MAIAKLIQCNVLITLNVECGKLASCSSRKGFPLDEGGADLDDFVQSPLEEDQEELPRPARRKVAGDVIFMTLK